MGWRKNEHIGQNGNDGVHYDLEEEKPEVKIVEKIVEVPVEVEKVVEKIVEKKVYGEDIEEKLKLLKHPRIKEAIKHAKRSGEL